MWLLAEDLTHGVMEAHAEDGGEEVDGVTGEVTLWPTPVGVFDDETREGGEVEVLGFAFDESEAALLQHGRQGDEASGADLVAGPAGAFFIVVGGHGLFSSGVE